MYEFFAVALTVGAHFGLGAVWKGCPLLKVENLRKGSLSL
jgi:hypothetical protein